MDSAIEFSQNFFYELIISSILKNHKTVFAYLVTAFPFDAIKAYKAIDLRYLDKDYYAEKIEEIIAFHSEIKELLDN
jgi:hypothetical protein